MSRIHRWTSDAQERSATHAVSPARSDRIRYDHFMATPQPGIFAVGTPVHTHLEFDLHLGASPVELAAALASLDELHKPTAGINLVVGIAPRLWRQIAPDDCPASAADFVAITGAGGYEFPASQHHAWVWIATGARDAAFDATRAVIAALAPIAELADDADGFAYHDSRDLSGFIDGTANRGLNDAAEVAAVADGKPGAGASIVLIQRWIHDLAALHTLDVAEQEKVFGQTKDHGIELDPLPADSHVAKVEIDDENGEELEIFRRSVPIGDARAAGLEFVAFSADRTTIDKMLAAMAGADDGVRDRLLDFSTPVTGSYYVAPTTEMLHRFAR